MSNDTQSVEATNPVLGSLKVSGANLNTIFTILGFILTALIAYALYTHTTDTKEASKELSGAMREMTQATREQNCLIAQPQELRVQNSDWCKRLAR